METWDAAARAMERDESLSVDDRITALLPRIWLAQLRAAEGDQKAEEDEPELPADLVEHVRERVAWAGEKVHDESELQTVMSTMVFLLDEAGLDAEAEVLLTERMGDALAPYYFMSWVAGMKRDAGQPLEAIAWYRKAYDSSRGRYSRFRWGSTYLRRRMDLAPQETARIEADSLEILGELLTFDDAFAGGNYSRLGELESAYETWSEDGDRAPTLSRIRGIVHSACGRYPAGDDDSQQARCQAFLG
jgi:tetratricopeptide (TPR) repeat protein